MPSSIETGHAKNVANFQLLLENLTTLGTRYNPSNPAITLAALNTKLSEAKNAMENHRSVKVVYDNAVNAREIQFKDLQAKATLVINALEASGAAPQTVKDAKTVIRKIRGKRAPVKNDITPAAPPGGTVGEPGEVQPAGSKKISASQRSYDQTAENFFKLLEIVKLEPKYNPNETDLKAADLKTYAHQLTSSTGAVVNQGAVYTSSIIARDAVLYGNDTGIPDLARDIKAYVKSIFGSSSPQYKSVRGIPFKDR